MDIHLVEHECLKCILASGIHGRPGPDTKKRFQNMTEDNRSKTRDLKSELDRHVNELVSLYDAFMDRPTMNDQQLVDWTKTMKDDVQVLTKDFLTLTSPPKPQSPIS
jgi:hypothetical protein